MRRINLIYVVVEDAINKSSCNGVPSKIVLVKQDQKFNNVENWVDENNPYESLPKMVMMTYQMPESITQITDTGEFNEFDLNEFFKAEGKEDEAKFKHENYVQQWLDLIRGSGFNNIYTNLQLFENKPVLPFDHSRLKIF